MAPMLTALPCGSTHSWSVSGKDCTSFATTIRNVIEHRPSSASRGPPWLISGKTSESRSVFKATYMAKTIFGFAGLWLAIVANAGATVRVMLKALHLRGHNPEKMR